jgi:hypothetical protein
MCITDVQALGGIDDEFLNTKLSKEADFITSFNKPPMP